MRQETIVIGTKNCHVSSFSFVINNTLKNFEWMHLKT